MDHLALRGNVQEIMGQHYTLHFPEAFQCYKCFSSLHKLFIDNKHSPCCHLRTIPWWQAETCLPCLALFTEKGISWRSYFESSGSSSSSFSPGAHAFTLSVFLTVLSRVRCLNYVCNPMHRYFGSQHSAIRLCRQHTGPGLQNVVQVQC